MPCLWILRDDDVEFLAEIDIVPCLKCTETSLINQTEIMKSTVP